MKKSTRKTGQDEAKANALLKTLRATMAPNSTGFLPNLRYEYSHNCSLYLPFYRMELLVIEVLGKPRLGGAFDQQSYRNYVVN